MSCSIAMSCEDAFSSAVAVMVGGGEGVVGMVGWCGRVNVVVAILVVLVDGRWRRVDGFVGVLGWVLSRVGWM